MNSRRDILRSAAMAVTVVPGRVLGANDRISIAFLGVGSMGTGNLKYAMQQPGVHVAAVCDVYQPSLAAAAAEAIKGGHNPKLFRDFREILADKSIDAVCVSTPDHWHAYMTVAACRAGKDVWVEKPICTTVEEGRKMVEAARKYNRIVQVGTMQRSGDVFQKASQIVHSGQLGKITMVQTWNAGNNIEREGMGNPPDCDPPADLDWDLWLGPAPKRPFNPNRFFRGNFRRFWDYAGGMMTDWGVHWLDIVQMAFDEAIPSHVSASGGKLWVTDNRETPDTLLVTLEYPGFLCTYQWREFNYGGASGGGITFHGTRGTVYVDRGVCRLTPEKGSDLKPLEQRARLGANMPHWANFLDSIRTRRKPLCDIEVGYRSTSTCLIGNVALRSGLRVQWDGVTIAQSAARPLLSRENRGPWKLNA